MNSIQKVVLVIIDGWGYRSEKKGNAIAQALTPHYSRFLGEYPNGLINASSHFVGLPQGVMGNSEVGHMNIGAGRPILQDQVRINESISNGAFFSNPVLQNIAQSVKSSQSDRLHLVGLVSDGCVHSSEKHYLSLLEALNRAGVSSHRIVFHAILDGRDTPPKSARGYLERLEKALAEHGGRIGSVSGRFYAMDRDKRWDRTDHAYRALVLGKGLEYASALEALEAAYARGESDEFMLPSSITHPSGSAMKSGDHVLCFNFRADRMRQLARSLVSRDTPVPSIDSSLKVHVSSFIEYDKTLGIPVVFQTESYDMTLGELVEKSDLHQFRTAETEKYAHVTYFFNCGREDPFPREDRELIASPKVRTYDLQPEMNSALVTQAVVGRIRERKHALIVVNYAQPDMVGHTGNFDAAIEAVEATDRALGAIVNEGLDHGYQMLITADHGNIEMMIDPLTGQPHTAHTTNLVPLLCIGPTVKRYRVKPRGALCDVAPTVLQMMNLGKPAEMTGQSLLSLT